MSEARGGKAASSFLFKLIESVGMQLISFVVSVLLARLLTPDDYGILTMLTVFIALAQVFVTSGLNTALIQQKDVDDTDLSSVFYVSFGMAAVMYALLYVSSPAIAAYFEAPALRDTLRVLSLILFAGAFTCVQNAVVARQMAFRRQMLLSLAATIASGVVGVSMALAGMGHWALVGQQLVNQFGLAALMFVWIPWRPRLRFSWKRVARLIRFGWKLLVSSILDTTYINLRSVVVGKRFNEAALGFYNRGKQFPELVMNAVNGSISSVMLPVLAESQDDKERMKQLLRQTIMTSSFLVLPLMAGLAAAGKPLITLLLTEKWLPCVPFLQIMAMDYALYPVHVANLAAINAQGRSDIFLKLEIIKKSYGLAILAVAVFAFDTVEAIAWTAVIGGCISAFTNGAPNRKLLGYGFLRQLRDLAPSLLLSAAMFLLLSAMNALPLHPAAVLAVQVAAGAAFYLGLSWLLKLESLRMMTDTLLKLLRKQR